MQDFNQKSARADVNSVVRAVENLVNLHIRRLNGGKANPDARAAMGFVSGFATVRGGSSDDDIGAITIFGLNYKDRAIKSHQEKINSVEYFFISQLQCSGFEIFSRFTNSGKEDVKQLRIWTKATPETVAKAVEKAAVKYATDNGLGKYLKPKNQTNIKIDCKI